MAHPPHTKPTDKVPYNVTVRTIETHVRVFGVWAKNADEARRMVGGNAQHRAELRNMCDGQTIDPFQIIGVEFVGVDK